MKQLFFFILIILGSLTLTSAQALPDEYDAAGAVMVFKGVIKNTVIRNAIIQANPFVQIFDTSVTLINCRTNEFSSAWFGAKNDIIDNSVYLQKCITTCISNRISNLFIADNYSYSQSLLAYNIYKGNYVGFALNIYGQGDMWSDKTNLTYTGKSFAFGVQCAKGGSIKKLKIQGDYIAPVFRDSTYYQTSFPVRSGYSGIVVDYDGTKNSSGSSGYTIEDTWVDGFDVLYCISPSATTFNADMIRMNHIRCGNGRIGIQSNQAQEKGNEINYVASWGSLHTLLQIGNSGKFQAGQYTIRGGNIAGLCVQLFDISLSGWNGFSVDGLAVESIGRIGTIIGNTSIYLPSANLSNMTIRFALRKIAGTQTLFSANSHNVKISNSNLWYYGQPGEMKFSGSFTFDHVDLGLSTYNNQEIIKL